MNIFQTKKQKEKEVKEEFSNQKKERYEKSKKEREEEEKKSLLEKEKNKNILEKKLKSEKANFRKLLLEKEQNEKESLEQKRAKIFSPSSSSNRFRPKKKSHEFDLENKSAILNNTISEFYIREEDENPKSRKVKNLKNSQNMSIKNYQTIKKHSTTMNIFQTKKLKENNKKRPNTLRDGEKNKEKEKKEKGKEKNEKEKENKEIIDNKVDLEKEEKEKENKLKNELEQKYLNNNEIYRCIFCSRIPLINLNQYDHLINLKCCCKNSYLNNNIYNYEYFTQKSLDHPILENNIICHYCQKKLSELKEENNINIKYCDFCNFYICSKDDLMHTNYHSWIRHQALKEKYKNIFLNKNIINKSKPLKPRKSTENKSKLSTSQKGIKSKKRNSALNEETNKNKNLNKNEVIQDKDKEKENDKEKDKNISEKQIPLYMMDSICLEHYKIYNCYCFDCNKNICPKCEEKHKEHNLINLSEIEIKEDDILNMKKNLEKEINDLKNINDYFLDLLEKIKKEFINLYELKKKEIEIKQKIINNYEITIMK